MAAEPTEKIPTLPPGYMIEGERETSQLVPGHGVQQGIVYGVRHPSGLATTVFVPYARLGDTAYVAKLLADHVAAVAGPEALSTVKK